MRKPDPMLHVHVVKRALANGRVEIYRYHRLTRRRLYCVPGTAAFEAEVAIAGADAGPTVPHEGKLGRRATRIYFIQGVVSGLIKIGKAARPHVRLASLQCGSPEQLELLATVEDKTGGTLEVYLHERFRRLRRHGEWFAPGEELMEYVRTHGTRLSSIARPRATRLPGVENSLN